MVYGFVLKHNGQQLWLETSAIKLELVKKNVIISIRDPDKINFNVWIPQFCLFS